METKMTSEEKEAPAPTTNTREPELFTASDVARFCQVDLKTIHNWADKGEIRHFRTPGRHLRFRRLDVLDFLRKYGYPIPEVLRMGKPKVVVVDEDPGVLAAVRRTLAKKFDLVTFQDAFDALVAVGQLQPDALVLDVKMPGLDGVRALERLRGIDATAHIRCLVYSMHEDAKKAATDAGAYDFVKKGELAELRDSLERLMGLERG
jgi:excisionase family DNA binding protein